MVYPKQRWHTENPFRHILASLRFFCLFLWLALCPLAHVRFGSEADICSAKRHVCFTPNSDTDCV